jgi:hypothetical protein
LLEKKVRNVKIGDARRALVEARLSLISQESAVCCFVHLGWVSLRGRTIGYEQLSVRAI